MPRDLLVIVPSRGRPGNVARFVRAVAKTSAAATDVVFAFDDDDPSFPQNVAAAAGGPIGVSVMHGPRKGLAAWTNTVAAAHLGAYQAFASFGDDHVPQTRGWDKLLLDAIAGMGGTGIAYPNDGVRDDVCEAVVVSADIVAALGWMCLPALQHWWVDNVWADLGRGADCLAYMPEVLVPHKHPAVTGTGQIDGTYRDSGRHIPADQKAYETWRAERMETDVATVQALRAARR
jgi:hypothetical protein